MMEKKRNNPISYRLRSNSWSELPPDLLNLVFERLGFADSLRVETVCSLWNSAVKRRLVKKQNPWLILLPDQDDRISRHCCKLFNSEEKGKLYKIRDEGIEFTKSCCLATYGNWLFILDYWNDLYLLNLFTHETIDLPPVESQRGIAIMMERTCKGLFCIGTDLSRIEFSCDIIHSPVFWIDEQTKEYVVIWGVDQWCVVYSKKGYKFWYQIPIPHESYGPKMVYKDHKLYYLINDYYGTRGFIKIFDFSGEIPQEIFQCGLPANIRPPPIEDAWWLSSIKPVVTVTGDMLKVEQWYKPINSHTWSFRVYKVYSSGCFKNYEQVDSLGQEAMLFDLGSTVLANDDIVGFKRNSIYFNIINYEEKTTQIYVFNLETQETEETLHKFDCSSFQQLRRARWFLPSFRQT